MNYGIDPHRVYTAAELINVGMLPDTMVYIRADPVMGSRMASGSYFGAFVLNILLRKDPAESKCEQTRYVSAFALARAMEVSFSAIINRQWHNLPLAQVISMNGGDDYGVDVAKIHLFFEKEREYDPVTALVIRYQDIGDRVSLEEILAAMGERMRINARKYSKKVYGVLTEDELISAQTLALLGGVETYDRNRGAGFMTFISRRLEGAIKDEMRLMDNVPRRARYDEKVIKKAARKYRQEHGEEPSIEDIARTAGLEVERVVETMRVLRHAKEQPLEVRMKDNKAHQPIDVLIGNEQREIVIETIREMYGESIKAGIFEMYFLDLRTMADIGSELEMSESRVCQIISDEEEMIRKVLREKLSLPERKKVKALL